MKLAGSNQWVYVENCSTFGVSLIQDGPHSQVTLTNGNIIITVNVRAIEWKSDALTEFFTTHCVTEKTGSLYCINVKGTLSQHDYSPPNYLGFSLSIDGVMFVFRSAYVHSA